MNPIFDLAKAILSEWKSGNKFVRIMIVSGIFLTLISLLVAGGSGVFLSHKEALGSAAKVFVGSGVALLMGVYLRHEIDEDQKRKEKIEFVEQKAFQHPNETQASWDLARIKLETYLERNIAQVRSIFWLTTFVMLVGFSIIGYAVFHSFNSPDKIAPTVISACSGILVSFIGATFLIIYKSTMAQAEKYVTILERINAVGMSVQILEKIGDDSDNLRQKTTAEISKYLLQLYSFKSAL